jgi:hypothetical protein
MLTTWRRCQVAVSGSYRRQELQLAHPAKRERIQTEATALLAQNWSAGLVDGAEG